MHYVALATDYDGTIAHDGRVNDATCEALARLRRANRRLVLVTGREIPDLRRAFPELEVFDLVVAENGALLYWPQSKQERPLVEPPDHQFVDRLRALGVDPLSVGRSIVATWTPNETKVLQAIRELGLELTITFNKGAVMVLPAGVNKASGLRAALEELEVSPLNCVAIGDAENDMAFLDVAGTSVAVANAVPALQDRAAWVTPGDHGKGVAQLVERLLDTDLADLDPQIDRQCVTLATEADGRPRAFVPHRETLLLCGASGGGKSTLTQGLTERIVAGGFQFCMIDPEGDYDGMASAVGIGDADHAPTPGQAAAVLSRPDRNAVVNLLGITLEDRPAFLATLLPELNAERMRTGRPHCVIVDEAHHMLPADFDPGEAVLPEDLAGFLFVTTRPNVVSSRLLRTVDRLLIVGAEPDATLRAFCQVLGRRAPDAPSELARGEVLVFDVADDKLSLLKVIPGERPRLRHRRKYAEGRLADDRSFWFRGPEGRLRLRAYNLTLFLEMGDGVDAETWQWHRSRQDFSHWIEEEVKDDELSREVADIETGDLPVDEARRAVREAVARRYTAPG